MAALRITLRFLILHILFFCSSSHFSPKLETIFGLHVDILKNVTFESTRTSSDNIFDELVQWPHLVCGPISELESKRLELQSLMDDKSTEIPVVFIKKSIDTVCFLFDQNVEMEQSSSASSDITQASAKSSSWVHLDIPPLLKVDDSAIEYFHIDEQQSTATNSNEFGEGDGGGSSSSSSASSKRSREKTFASMFEGDGNGSSGVDLDKEVDVVTRTGAFQEDASVSGSVITIEFSPFALSQYPVKELSSKLLQTSVSDVEFAQSEVFELLFHHREASQRGADRERRSLDETVRRLQALDCSVDSSDERVVLGSRTLHVTSLHEIPEECVAQIVYRAVSAAYVLRVLVDSRAVLLNSDAAGMTSTGSPFDDSYRKAGLTGLNQIVGIADSGLNERSCFFRDDSAAYPSDLTDRSGQLEDRRRKVIQYIGYADGEDDLGGHGTHVAGTVCGNSDGAYSSMNGVAPEARIAFFDIGKSGSYYLDVPELYTVLFPAALEAGARVHTNSWGSARRQYSYQTYDVDRTTWENPDLLVLFAAGNSGSGGVRTLGSPANAKNCVAVGAGEGRDSDTDELLPDLTVAWFSSIGPTADGRIKPDVIAPGSFLMSALAGPAGVSYDPSMPAHSYTDEVGGNCAAGSKMGTSMATPATAGAALQLRQYFMDSHFWASTCNKLYPSCAGGAFSPSGYLLKALLLHSASPMVYYSHPDFDFKTRIPSFELGDAPDVFQGYGSVTLSNVLPLPNSAGLKPPLDLLVWDRLQIEDFSAKLWRVEFKVADMQRAAGDDDISSDLLRVTLCWYDPPAPLGFSGSLLMHDLDLLVVSPNNSRFWGNRGVYPGDESNPNEQVTVRFPSDECAQLTKAAHGTDSAATCVYDVYVRASALPVGGAQSAAVVFTTNGVVTGPEDTKFPFFPEYHFYDMEQTGNEEGEGMDQDAGEGEGWVDSPNPVEEETGLAAQQESLALESIAQAQQAVFESYLHGHGGGSLEFFLKEGKKSDESHGQGKSKLKKGMVPVEDTRSRYFNFNLDKYVVTIPPTRLYVHEERIVLDTAEEGDDYYYSSEGVVLNYHREIVPIDQFTLAGYLLRVKPVLMVSKFANMTNPSGSKVSGVYPYFLALIVRDPRGVTLQIGGVEWYAAAQRLFYREWPRTWTRWVPGDARFRAVREVEDAELAGFGEWTVEITLGYNGKVPPAYFAGNITFEFAPIPLPTCHLDILLADGVGDGWDDGAYILEVSVDTAAESEGSSSPGLVGRAGSVLVRPKALKVGVENTNITLQQGQIVNFHVASKHAPRRGLEPWEVFWAVKSGKQSFIGGLESRLQLQCIAEPSTSLEASPPPLSSTVKVLVAEKLPHTSLICKSCSPGVSQQKQTTGSSSSATKNGNNYKNENKGNTDYDHTRASDGTAFGTLQLTTTLMLSNLKLFGSGLSSTSSRILSTADANIIQQALASVLASYNPSVTILETSIVASADSTVSTTPSSEDDSVACAVIVAFGIAVPYNSPSVSAYDWIASSSSFSGSSVESEAFRAIYQSMVDPREVLSSMVNSDLQALLESGSFIQVLSQKGMVSFDTQTETSMQTAVVVPAGSVLLTASSSVTLKSLSVTMQSSEPPATLSSSSEESSLFGFTIPEIFGTTAPSHVMIASAISVATALVVATLLVVRRRRLLWQLAASNDLASAVETGVTGSTHDVRAPLVSPLETL